MNRAIAWFAQNHVAANLLMALLVVAGLMALPRMQQKPFPDINVEVIQIGVPYLGAAPEEVEQGVCLRVEEAIQDVVGVETITSSAAEGACGVTAELISGSDVDRVLVDVKNAVDSLTTLPEETERPVVSHFTIRRNAIQVALSGPADERTLKVLGERVRDEMARLPGITQVELANARAYEISIEVAEESLRRHRLSFDQVVNAVRQSSLDLPGGAIKASGGEILLRSKGQAYRGPEFERLVLLSRADGTRLHLGDVARVVDGFDEDERFATFDGEPAVLIQVFRVGDQKVLELVDQVKRYVAEAGSRLPEGVKLTVWRDGAQTLRDRLDILLRNGRGGFFLVFVVLGLFLRLRLAFWVSLGVPISFLGALWLFPTLDLSIDVITLFAFILVLGLLVDDAIVVGENIHTHQERHEDPLQASIVGAQEVAVPVIFGVLTTIAAFLPLLTAPGPMGQVFSTMGTVVVCCLIFSLVESQLILPAHLGHVRIRPEHDEHERRGPLSRRFKTIQAWLSSALERLATQRYRPALGRALEWRYATLAIAVVLLAWTAALVGSGRMRFSFFPPVESDYVSASLTMPQGTPVERTAAAVAAIASAADAVRAELDDEHGREGGESLLKHVLTSVGEQPSRSGGHSANVSGRASGGSHLGEVSIELMSADGRPLSARAVADRWRESTPDIPDAVELVFSSSLFSAGEAINIQLQSTHFGQLQEAAARLKDRLAEYAGVTDIADSFRAGKEEVKLSILPSAEMLGLSLNDLARQVRQAFYGAEAQRIQRGRDDVRVMVRYPRAQRRSLGDLQNMRIRTPEGAEVPFHTVARAERGRGYATIRRVDRSRAINVTADVDRARANANEVMASLRKGLLPELLADYPGLSYDLSGEQREQGRVLGGLRDDYVLALVLIYALLAVPLRSYAQPLIIMAVIPFGLVGAVAGHMIMGMHLSMMSIFGVVALSGVVVNSSLVLVHYVNSRRATGMSEVEAVGEAGVARFRPIVLTSLTTFAGLTPLLLERSVTAQFLIPMATSLAFGVVFATAITLFLVPASYLILEDARRALQRLFGAGSEPPAGTREEPPAEVRRLRRGA